MDHSNGEVAPAYLSTSDVKPILGLQPYFGQGKKTGDLLPDTDTSEHSPTQSVRHRGLRIVFVGLQEPTNVTSEFTNPEDAKKLEGTPYFSADISTLEYTPEGLQEFLDNTTLGREGKVLTWTNPRALVSTLDPFNAGVFASAKSLVDWNLRNKVRIPLRHRSRVKGMIIILLSFVLVADLHPIRCWVVGKSLALHFYLGQTKENDVLQRWCLFGIKRFH